MSDRENKPLTISDIAEALGVSKTTVSRAISGKGRIGRETKARVLRYITEHNYTPSAIAKALAKSTTYNISVVLPSECSMAELPFFQNCLNGIVNMAASMEYDVIITPVYNNDISQLQRAVANHKVDGVILTRTVKNDEAIRYLKEVQMPFVAIGMSDEDVVQVDADHLGGARELTSMLINNGCSKIGLIGSSSSYMLVQKRLRGFMEAFEAAGMQFNEDLVYLDVEGAAKTEEVVSQLLDKHVDCIMCMDDSLCIYAINKIKAEYIRVPEDIQIVSFYNSDILDVVTPRITALDYDMIEIGREAFRVLYDLMDGRKIKSKTLLGYNVIVKDSTK